MCEHWYKKKKKFAKINKLSIKRSHYFFLTFGFSVWSCSFISQFGDSQKLRLVRILRSTVMVRVGGGWIALDEFLVKNDPCRGKSLVCWQLRLNVIYNCCLHFIPRVFIICYESDIFLCDSRCLVLSHPFF